MLASSLDWQKLRGFVGVFRLRFWATSSPGVAVCLEQIIVSWLMDKSLCWLVGVGLLQYATHDLCVQHLLTVVRTTVSI
jgi:hypothetical protein